MLEHKLIRCELDSPFRCQAVVKMGQCPFTAIETTKYCGMHTSGGQVAKTAATNYRITKWQGRLNELSNSEAVKSLRDEIGILRLMLEEIMNRCQDANDLLIYSGKIADLTVKIEKLVTSCHRLEMSSGNLLDKQSVLQLASSLSEIIGRHLQDADAIEFVSEEIFASIAQLNVMQKESELLAS